MNSAGWIWATVGWMVALKFYLKALHYEDLWRDTMRCWERSVALRDRLLAQRKP